MNKVWILVYILTTICVQATVQKMILSAHIETEDAAKDLYQIEKFFQENPTARSLQHKHDLSIQMELLDAHVLVTIKPIKDMYVKNTLNTLLREGFPQSFMVDDTPMVHKKPATRVPKRAETVKKVESSIKKSELTVAEVQEEKIRVSLYDEVRSFWSRLDSEWIGLIVLALAGFMLIYRSNRQISKIRALQKEVEVYQSQIEKDIAHIGESR